jgi:hypothetical protein
MALKLKSAGSGPANELPPPPEAFSAEASEVIRAWVVDGGLHVSMMKSFDEPEVWGVLLADVARHAANIYAREDGGSMEEVLARIAGIFRSELMDPTDDAVTESIQ